MTTRSGLLCDRIGGVKLNANSSSATGRMNQPATRNMNRISPGTIVQPEVMPDKAVEVTGAVKFAGEIEVV